MLRRWQALICFLCFVIRGSQMEDSMEVMLGCGSIASPSLSLVISRTSLSGVFFGMVVSTPIRTMCPSFALISFPVITRKPGGACFFASFAPSCVSWSAMSIPLRSLFMAIFMASWGVAGFSSGCLLCVVQMCMSIFMDILLSCVFSFPLGLFFIRVIISFIYWICVIIICPWGE